MSFDIIGKLRLIDEASRPLRQAIGKFTALGVAAAGVGAAVATVSIVTDSVKKAMDFEAQLSSIQALTNATDEQMKSMQNLALLEGARTKYSALEAAKGIEELVKAGIKPAQVEAGALGAALDLATAGELELADAAAIMSTSLNAFKSNGLSAAEAANILAGTANSGALKVADLKYGLAAVGAVADGVGLSFRDTNAALGLFANNGLMAQDAGTSLKTMLMNLSPATDGAYEAMRYLGIITKDGSNQFYDAENRLKSLADVSEVLRKSLLKFSDKDRQDLLREMFGSDAIRAATILFKEGGDGVKSFYKDMSRVTALEVARKKMDNAAGSVEELQGAIETLQISALLPTMPIIRDLADAAATLVTKYGPQITEAVEKAVNTARQYISDTFINNPEFQKLPDLESKVKFVFDDLLRVFNEWWGASGRSNFEAATAEIMGVLIDVVEASAPQIGVASVKIGQGIAFGVIKGIKENLNLVALLSPTASDRDEIMRRYDSASKLAEAAAANSTNNPGTPLYSGGEIMPAPDRPWYEDAWGAVSNAGTAVQNYVRGYSHASGLDNVPYNQYPASLHKGEAVLTRGEADEYRRERGGRGSSGDVVINLGGVVINNDTDIDDLCDRIARAVAG